MDVDTRRYHIHRDIYVWSKQDQQEYAIPKCDWSRWWYISKAFHNKRDGRMFAEVVQQPARRPILGITHKVYTDVGMRSFPPSKLCISKVVHTRPLTTANKKTSGQSVQSTISAHLPKLTNDDCFPIYVRY